MIQLFLKNKIAVGLTAVVLAGTIGMTIGGVVLGDKAKPRFPSDGYVLDVAVTEDGQQMEVKTMNFASDSALHFRADDSLVFTDAEQVRVCTKGDSFIHYSNDSLTSAGGMVLTDLDEVSLNSV